eukprot:jgi/Psemu1/60109/gm1.60109_g
MDELPPSEVSKAHKRHISSLIANTTLFWHSKAIGGRMRVRDNQVLDIAAQRAQRGHPIINLVLHTMHWKFHKDWYPYEFHKVYTTTTGIQSDETGLSHRTKPTAPVVSETLPVPSHPTFAPSGTTALIHTKSAVSNPILTAPIKPVESKSHTAIKVPTYCVTSSSATTALPTIKLIDSDVVATPSHTTTSVRPVTANLGPLQPVGPITNTPFANAPCHIWTWTYSPHSESVSFHRVNSISFRQHSSPPNRHQNKSIVTPVQRQDESSPVPTPSVSPSARPRFGHHPVPLYEPTDFRWTFNPQSESVVFHRLPKPALVPLQPSLQLPLLKAIPEDTILASAIPTFEQRGAYPSHFCCAIYSNPNQTVFCITKRHCDALKVKIYGSNDVYAPPLCITLDPVHVVKYDCIVIPFGHHLACQPSSSLARALSSVPDSQHNYLEVPVSIMEVTCSDMICLRCALIDLIGSIPILRSVLWTPQVYSSVLFDLLSSLLFNRLLRFGLSPYTESNAAPERFLVISFGFPCVIPTQYYTNAFYVFGIHFAMPPASTDSDVTHASFTIGYHSTIRHTIYSHHGVPFAL